MESQKESLLETFDTMTSSFSTARAALQFINRQTLDMTTGISLLSLKHHLLLSYLQSLVLVSSGRALGNTLNGRSAPTQAFSGKDRDVRGNQIGDVVDSMIENRAVLEKIHVLEAKMRYQIDKLVRIAEEPLQDSRLIDDPLVFRPNPSSLLQSSTAEHEASAEAKVIPSSNGDLIYRPPRMAPVPYAEKSKSQARRNRPPIPSALSSLSVDPSRPFIESSSGLGGTPALKSGRAQYLKRLKDFEEDNFTRIVMKKSDSKRRARDEEDLALGGDLGSGSMLRGRRRAGGLEDEFDGVLRSVSKVSGGHSQGDGYEELRQNGRKMNVLERSRSKKRYELDTNDDHEDSPTPPRKRQRSRFESDTKKTLT